MSQELLADVCLAENKRQVHGRSSYSLVLKWFRGNRADPELSNHRDRAGTRGSFVCARNIVVTDIEGGERNLFLPSRLKKYTLLHYRNSAMYYLA